MGRYTPLEWTPLDAFIRFVENIDSVYEMGARKKPKKNKNEPRQNQSQN